MKENKRLNDKNNDDVDKKNTKFNDAIIFKSSLNNATPSKNAPNHKDKCDKTSRQSVDTKISLGKFDNTISSEGFDDGKAVNVNDGNCDIESCTREGLCIDGIDIDNSNNFKNGLNNKIIIPDGLTNKFNIKSEIEDEMMDLAFILQVTNKLINQKREPNVEKESEDTFAKKERFGNNDDFLGEFENHKDKKARDKNIKLDECWNFSCNDKYVSICDSNRKDMMQPIKEAKNVVKCDEKYISDDIRDELNSYENVFNNFGDRYKKNDTKNKSSKKSPNQNYVKADKKIVLVNKNDKILNKRKAVVQNDTQEIQNKRKRLMICQQRHLIKTQAKNSQFDIFSDSFAETIILKKKKAKPNIAFSEGDYKMLEKRDLFANKDFPDVIQNIKDKFNSKLYDRQYENDSIHYLKEKIIKTPINTKKVMPELCPIDDPYNHTFDNNTKIALETLILYCKRKVCVEKAFINIFDTKDMYRIIEQFTNENSIINKKKLQLLQLITNQTEFYNETIINAIINEFILYINNHRHYNGIPEICNLFNILLLKINYDDKKMFSMLRDCFLPLLLTDVIEIVSEDIIFSIYNTLINENMNLIIYSFTYFCKHFSICKTKSRILILQLIQNIMKQHQELNFEKIIIFFNKILNEVFISENQNLIEMVFNYFTDYDIFEIIKKNIFQITPFLFNNLYILSKKYWNYKGKSNVFIILQRVMNCDMELFSKCLRDFNINLEKEGLNNQFYDNITKELFESCLDSFDKDNILKMRRKSILPFESDKYGA